VAQLQGAFESARFVRDGMGELVVAGGDGGAGWQR
jgi:hypothetical protein